MFVGVRPQPEAIWKWIIIDRNDPEVFFSGWYCHDRYPDKDFRVGERLSCQIPVWTLNVRCRREWDDKAEAAEEAALVVELGCRMGRAIDVVRVGRF